MQIKRRVVGWMIAGLGATVAAFFGGRAVALVPESDALNYSGRLTNGGVPVDGVYGIQILAFAAATGGQELCSTAASVGFIDGYFKVPMESCRDDLLEHQGLWIEVHWEGGPPIGPRTLTGAVPYALEASRAAAPTPGSPLEADLDEFRTHVETEAVHREVSAQYRATTGQTLSMGAYTTIDFDSRVYDATAATVTPGANWRFVAPVSGKYLVSVSLTIVSPTNALTSPASGGAAAWFEVRTAAGGVAQVPGETNNPDPSFAFLGGTTIVSVAAGDALSIAVRQRMSADAELNVDAPAFRTNYVSIQLLD